MQDTYDIFGDIETDYNDQMIFFMEKIPLKCAKCSFTEEIEYSFYFYGVKIGEFPDVPVLCPKCAKERDEMTSIVNKLIVPVLRKDWATVNSILKDLDISEQYEICTQYFINTIDCTETEDDLIGIITTGLSIIKKER